MWPFGLKKIRRRRQWNSSKIKAHLKMAIGRIEIIKNKRTAILKENMKQIATLLSEISTTTTNNPLQQSELEEKAYFRTQGIVRDDYYIGALEIIQLHCELLHERLGPIELYVSKKWSNHDASACVLPSSDVLSLVCTIIWSTPYFMNDIPELSYISRKLSKQFGKSFVNEYVTTNQHGCLNEQVVTKLSSATTPPPFLIRVYMEKICDLYGVDWKPSSSDHNSNDDGDDCNTTNNNNPNPPPPSNNNNSRICSYGLSNNNNFVRSSGSTCDDFVSGFGSNNNNNSDHTLLTLFKGKKGTAMKNKDNSNDRSIMSKAITGISTRKIVPINNISDDDVLPDYGSTIQHQQRQPQPTPMMALPPKSTAPIGSERSLTSHSATTPIIQFH